MIGLGVVGQPISLANPAIIDTGFGVPADCSTFFGYSLNTGCWKYSLPAWQQMAQFGQNMANAPLPVPPSAVPLTNTGQPNCATSDCSSEIGQTLTTANQQTQQNNLDYWATIQDVGDTSELWTMGLIVGGVILAFLVFGRR